MNITHLIFRILTEGIFFLLGALILYMSVDALLNYFSKKDRTSPKWLSKIMEFVMTDWRAWLGFALYLIGIVLYYNFVM